MFFQRVVTPSLAIHSYLLGDEKTKRCVVVDPTRHVVPYIIQAQNAGLDITDILETHVHADFVSGARELKHQLNEKPCIYVSGMGGSEWIPAYADEIVRQDAQIVIGDIRLQALHTPGHTPEHLTWICYDDSRCSTTPWFAFTGDCLFVGSIGRPDLLGNQEIPFLTSQLYHTLFEILAPLPDFVEIFPSHGKGSLCGKAMKDLPSSTIGYERLFNPYFQKKSQAHWLANVLEGQPPIPPYFQRVKQLNLEGPPLLSSLKTHKWDETEGAPPLEQLFLLDVRHPEVFACSHIQGSLNIPLSPTFTQWAGWWLPAHTPIGLIVENTHVIAEIVDQLRLIGMDQDIWTISLAGESSITDVTRSSLTMMDVEELVGHQPIAHSFYLLDVRTQEEWQTEHILGAHHVELHALKNSLYQLPDDQTIAVLCRSGQRSSIAASLLQKYGFKSVVNVRGGMQAWKQLGLPLQMAASHSFL